MALSDITVTTPIFSSAKNGQVTSLQNLFAKLASIVSAQEKDLNTEIDNLNKEGGTIDQGALLKVQGMVQSWGVTSGLATGTLRAAGDALTKTTQNIR